MLQTTINGALPYRTDKARWQSFGKGNLEKAPLGGASHPCLDKLSKNADNLVDYSQFSDYQKWVKNQVKGVIELIKKHVPMVN